MEEIQLIKLSQEGQVEAFRQLFQLHGQRIFSLAYSYLKNAQDAEDILQETFIKAFQALSSFRQDRNSSFSGWLSRIGINCCLDLLRQKKAQLRRENSLKNMSLINHNLKNSGQNLELKEQAKVLASKIEHFLDYLPPKQRMVFILRHYQGYSIREIAEDMGVSEGTVKKMLFRAFATIRRYFKKYLMENAYEVL
ncbi:MAG TPA: RNA polymerase sigma factor [Candidatus Aminicenantes bacterium]|nr:RNA polymerase sigma factor [Candidatus Aminicenantes bacterium]